MALFPLTGKGGVKITREMALPRSGGVDFVKGGVLGVTPVLEAEWRGARVVKGDGL